MTPQLRQFLLENIQNHESVLWAGAVASVGDKLRVHMFRTGVTEPGMRHLNGPGKEIEIRELGPAQVQFMNGSVGHFSEVLAIPHEGATLIGQPVADRFAAILNEHCQPEALVRAMRTCVHKMRQHMVPHTLDAISCLKQRALCEYAEMHRSLPNQQEFNAFIGQRAAGGARWAQLLAQPNTEGWHLHVGALALEAVREEDARIDLVSVPALQSWVIGYRRGEAPVPVPPPPRQPQEAPAAPARPAFANQPAAAPPPRPVRRRTPAPADQQDPWRKLYADVQL